MFKLERAAQCAFAYEPKENEISEILNNHRNVKIRNTE